jgi:hypothetical protein
MTQKEGGVFGPKDVVKAWLNGVGTDAEFRCDRDAYLWLTCGSCDSEIDANEASEDGVYSCFHCGKRWRVVLVEVLADDSEID